MEKEIRKCYLCALEFFLKKSQQMYCKVSEMAFNGR